MAKDVTNTSNLSVDDISVQLAVLKDDIASLTRKIRPGPVFAAIAARIVAGWTCTPSAISPADRRPSASTAPTRPGSRLPSWLIALKRCVAQAAPASTAATQASNPASLWPSETSTPAPVSARICSGVTASGASVIFSTGRRADRQSPPRPEQSRPPPRRWRRGYGGGCR